MMIKILFVATGAGGEEAALFAGTLFRVFNVCRKKKI